MFNRVCDYLLESLGGLDKTLNRGCFRSQYICFSKNYHKYFYPVLPVQVTLVLQLNYNILDLPLSCILQAEISIAQNFYQRLVCWYPGALATFRKITGFLITLKLSGAWSNPLGT